MGGRDGGAGRIELPSTPGGGIAGRGESFASLCAGSFWVSSSRSSTVSSSITSSSSGFATLGRRKGPALGAMRGGGAGRSSRSSETGRTEAVIMLGGRTGCPEGEIPTGRGGVMDPIGTTVIGGGVIEAGGTDPAGGGDESSGERSSERSSPAGGATEGGFETDTAGKIERGRCGGSDSAGGGVEGAATGGGGSGEGVLGATLGAVTRGASASGSERTSGGSSATTSLPPPSLPVRREGARTSSSTCAGARVSSST